MKKTMMSLNKLFSVTAAATVIATVAVIVFTSQTAHAYLNIGESGEVLPVGNYQFVMQPQFFTNEGGSTDAMFSLDAPFGQGMSSRFTIGAGKFSPTLGAGFKWIPFPDVDRQPAIGFKTQLWYGRYNSENYLTGSFAPLISRKMQTDRGLFVPYFAVPFNYTTTRPKDYYNQLFVFGTEFQHPDADLWTFGGEISLNLKDSFSYILLTVGYQFDSEKGLQLRRR